MRKNINKVLIFFISLGSSVCFSQDLGKMELLEMGVFLEKESLFMVDSKLILLEQQRVRIPQDENQVLISQIGSNNSIETNISSSDAVVNLVQQGNENLIQSRIQAIIVRQNIIETGDNNSYFSYANSSFKPVIENVHLNGVSNLVEKYGSNSITNQLKFNIQGDFKTLIIRSYE